MQRLQIFFGTLILFLALGNVISDYKNFQNIDTLRSFLLAPLFSISFIPLIYLIILVLDYDLLFMRINLGHEKNKKLRRYIKIKVIMFCLFNLKKINDLLNSNFYNLMHIRDNKDIDKIIDDYKTKQAFQK